MPIIKIDYKTCTKCGLCVEDCPKKIYSIIKKGDYPCVNNEETCIQCAHCLAICKTNSILFDPFPVLEINELIKDTNNSIESTLYSIRSIRKYKDEMISTEMIKKLILLASQAPAASNKRNVEILIISDREIINHLEYIVIRHLKRLLRLINPVIRYFISLLSKSLNHYFKETIPSLNSLINNYKKGINPVFRNAPYLAVFQATKSNNMSKDNVDGSVHYFRLSAHSLGFGSCMIGYANVAHKSIEKYLKIPNNKEIYAVLTFGVPKYRYDKMIVKKPYLLLTQD